jgi:hypothetical protein
MLGRKLIYCNIAYSYQMSTTSMKLNRMLRFENSESNVCIFQSNIYPPCSFMSIHCVVQFRVVHYEKISEGVWDEL